MNAAPPRTWTITLPLLPISMNRRERVTWQTRHAERLRIEQFVWALGNAARMPRLTVEVPNGRRTERRVLIEQRRAVSVHLVKPMRGQPDDPANRDSRAKSVLDALVRCGYLIDDSDPWLDWQGVTETRSTDGPATIITITESE